MFKVLTSALAVTAALASVQAVAAPAAPTLDNDKKFFNYSFVEFNRDGRGSYKQLFKFKDQVNVNIKWNAWGAWKPELRADSYKVYFGNEIVAEGAFSAPSNGSIISFPYNKGGRFDMTLELCNATGCTQSVTKELVIADTDGAHLGPLEMNVDPNNKTYSVDPNTVVGAYFVEWGIYGRKFDATQIPGQNLTHILYGFIPICGENESLKPIENGNSWRALQAACADSQDYEVVIHDPWAAVQKNLPGINNDDPIQGTYAQLMALKKRYPHVKILPSVGGWTLTDPFYGFTEKANRDVFVASVKSFLKQWKFYDGVDIDWEFPGGGGPNAHLGDPVKDGPAYIALMKELRAMLDELQVEMGRAEPFELTSAIGMGFDKIEDVNYLKAAPYMDYIFAMTYDFYGGWNNVTGHQTALYCGSHMTQDECNGTGVDDNGNPRRGPAYTTHNGIQFLLDQGVPASKVVMGAAMYGRGWEGVFPANATDPTNPMTAPGNGKFTGSKTQGVWEDGIMDYKGIKKYLIGPDGTGINGYEVGYDVEAEGGYVWNKSTGKMLTYDAPRAVEAKGQYVRSRGLAGIFAWEIDADNGDILNAMHEGLAGGGTGNNKPVVSLQANAVVDSEQSVTLAASASDRDNDTLTYTWTFDAALTATGQGTDTLVVTAPAVTTDTQYTVTLSVSDGTDTVSKSATLTVKAPKAGNTAPVVGAIADVSVAESQSVAVSVSASDADNDTLSYSWSAPGLTVNGSGANVTLVAGNVDADTVFPVTVTVSDGTESVQTSFNVTVTNTDTGGGCTGGSDWSATQAYNAGQTVTHCGKTFRSLSWNQNAEPGSANQWAEDNGVWNNQFVYLGGDVVTHNNVSYTAKYWNKGDTPGDASWDAWKKN